MTARNLNGASLHVDRSAPDATSCWLTALEQRRQQLLGQLNSLELQRAGAEKLEHTRLSMVRLAEAVAEADAAELERLRDRLDEFDRESDRLLAETAGCVKRARAAIEHRRNPSARGGLPATPEDLAALDADLRSAEKSDGELLAKRLAAREPIHRQWLDAARRGLQAGLQLLALAEPDMAALKAAQAHAGSARRELEHLNALAAIAVAAEDRGAA